MHSVVKQVLAEVVRGGEASGVVWRAVIRLRRTSQERATLPRDLGRWVMRDPEVEEQPRAVVLDARPGNPPKRFEAVVKDPGTRAVLFVGYFPTREAAMEAVEEAWTKEIHERLSIPSTTLAPTPPPH